MPLSKSRMKTTAGVNPSHYLRMKVTQVLELELVKCEVSSLGSIGVKELGLVKCEVSTLGSIGV